MTAFTSPFPNPFGVFQFGFNPTVTPFALSSVQTVPWTNIPQFQQQAPAYAGTYAPYSNPVTQFVGGIPQASQIFAGALPMQSIPQSLSFQHQFVPTTTFGIPQSPITMTVSPFTGGVPVFNRGAFGTTFGTGFAPFSPFTGVQMISPQAFSPLAASTHNFGASYPGAVGGGFTDLHALHAQVPVQPLPFAQMLQPGQFVPGFGGQLTGSVAPQLTPTAVMH